MNFPSELDSGTSKRRRLVLWLTSWVDTNFKVANPPSPPRVHGGPPPRAGPRSGTGSLLELISSMELSQQRAEGLAALNFWTPIVVITPIAKKPTANLALGGVHRGLVQFDIQFNSCENGNVTLIQLYKESVMRRARGEEDFIQRIDITIDFLQKNHMISFQPSGRRVLKNVRISTKCVIIIYNKINYRH